MGILKLPVVLFVLFVALNHLEGGGKPTESRQMEKRKCRTATCATQRLVNFLAPSGNKLGAIFSPMKMGSNTYGKRKKVEILKREPLSYLPI
ncbi:islet amyloid polypeptide [Cervus elaphus]|uniref:islet amyloid polypeptide n=1 Tax=Cervus canadensis TaxID=1574408 RepID=UPI001CA353B7|nr:islet amyloid polypeptide [Cervus canadensis]XP_043738350.1 islet amyloid polypeptide [Cervus elaphus]